MARRSFPAGEPVRHGNVWRWPDGTTVPVVSGGAGDDADDNDDGGDDASGDDKPETGDKPLSAEEARRIRAALKKANREAQDARTKLKQLEDGNKSDSEKLTERVADAEQRAEKAEADAMRLQVALSKGLNSTQAKRLVGTTVDELEADADELLAAFTPAKDGDGQGSPPPPGRQPSERLTPGGSEKPAPEPDVKDVLARIPRL